MCWGSAALAALVFDHFSVFANGVARGARTLDDLGSIGGGGVGCVFAVAFALCAFHRTRWGLVSLQANQLVHNHTVLFDTVDIDVRAQGQDNLALGLGQGQLLSLARRDLEGNGSFALDYAVIFGRLSLLGLGALLGALLLLVSIVAVQAVADGKHLDPLEQNLGDRPGVQRVFVVRFDDDDDVYVVQGLDKAGYRFLGLDRNRDGSLTGQNQLSGLHFLPMSIPDASFWEFCNMIFG